jgi:TRAP-type mannitol/chloroaromatic compound transport system substrate-binding protein
MTKQMSLDTLWNSATSKDRVFNSDEFAHLPEAARQYLEHAIARNDCN